MGKVNTPCKANCKPNEKCTMDSNCSTMHDTIKNPSITSKPSKVYPRHN